MRHFFGAVVGPDTVGIAKPDPRPFEETVTRLGLDSPRAVMIGDSETDILTARNAGVPVIGVPFGYTPRPVQEFGPDRMISHFDEAYDAIQELFALA
jgi:phosphoglycolate phosphatase